MPSQGLKQVVHRPGPFKQSNKAHKGGRSGKRHDKGKLGVIVSSRHKKRDLSRIERKNKMNQLRQLKKEAALKAKGRLRGVHAPPVLTTILALDDLIDTSEFLSCLTSCTEDLQVYESELGYCHVSYPRLKQRFSFLMPNRSDMHSVMDALKVSNSLLLLHSMSVPDEYTEMLLSAILAHSLPTTMHVIQGFDKLNPKKKAECRKQLSKNMEARFPGIKFHQADSNADFQLIMRLLGDQKQQPVAFRDNRFHLLAEKVTYDQPDPSLGTGTLKVTGYVRGQTLNVNKLVHIPGWGTYQMHEVHQESDSHMRDQPSFDMVLNVTETANPTEQESLQSEVIPDPMDGEQTWPTQEELDEAELQPKKTVRKVPEGTSDYQAAWIVESDNEISDASDDESHEESQRMSEDESIGTKDYNMDTDSVVDLKDDDYDKDFDMDEEKQTLIRFKEERMNQMFPDEQDTPIDISARVRYQKYRGLKDFSRAPWDPLENLPYDYARIYRFEHFKQTKKKVLNAEIEGFDPGEYVTIHIANVPQSLYDSVCTEKTPLVVFGLLSHEQKMSVINTVIRKHPSCKVPIKAKDTLIFHMGYTRFTCKPIFSELKTGNKFKYERFLPAGDAVVATFFAPVMFPPASVVVFRQKQDGTHELVATGSVLDVNPNRIVVKRILLSGHPMKILTRTAVVRYMFFNKDDINWFKSVELRTKCGRHGHIREALGSHGHMKCVFDKQLQSHDVVLMSLYKRVFPKWTYDPYVPSPVLENTSLQNIESMM